MKYICPSILSADFSRLGEEIKMLESAGADIIHCDIMDGHFVPNISFGPDIIARVNEITSIPLDVHLMIENADKYVDAFKKAGADYLSVHYENNVHLHRLVDKIKQEGMKAGVVLNPATPVTMLHEILPYVDYILIMSVNPGFGGQKFIKTSVNKVKQLKAEITGRNLNCMIEIDGGVDTGNIKMLSGAGVDMFVCGASVFKSGDPAGTIKQMKQILQA